MNLKKGIQSGFISINSDLGDRLEIRRDPSYKELKAQRPRVSLDIANQTKSIPPTKELQWEVSNRKIAKNPVNAPLRKERLSPKCPNTRFQLV